jgi:carboxypeptidase Q
MFRPAAAGVIALLLTIAPLGGREPVNDEINARIRKEGRENSQILRTMHYLTDVYGPRQTGSPNHKAAAEWAIKQMTEWGLTNGRLEPWDFGHPGWLNERFSGFIVSPVKDSLVGEVLAWTPSTNGVVTADAVQIVPPDRPTQEDMSRWVAETTPKVKGRIVLVGRHMIVPVNFNKTPLRRDDESLRRQYQPDTGPAPQGRQGPGPQGRGNAAATVAPGQLSDGGGRTG